MHVYLNKKEKQGPDFDIIVVPLKLLLDSCPAHPKRALLSPRGSTRSGWPFRRVW
jgi:hypothetical protein